MAKQEVDPEIRKKIRARALEAAKAGWKPELLWEANPWHVVNGKNRCGLAAVLRPGDEISKITETYIEVRKPSGVVLRFYHPDRPQPWFVS